MKIGIVGLPNAGKSTLFNALTAAGAPTGDYPFTTIDPNVAVVAVPDERLDRVAQTLGASAVIGEQIEFHDIAGLVPGASQGEGLGNRFLGAIRETDAICHVVRAHAGEGVPHPEGRVDPLGDVELIETELLAADLDTAERRLERVAKLAKTGEAEAVAERDWLAAVVDGLGSARPVRDFPAPGAAADAPRKLQALTAKPVLYVVNVDEGSDEVPAPLADRAAAGGAVAVAVSARIESELGELGDADEAAAMRAELGVGESGLERVIRGAWELLDLISFFTADAGKEAMARAIPAGSSAHAAAGKIHTDIQRRFVRAEVIGWEELIEAGGYAAARDCGLIRTEGRDYVVRDGEVLHIRH
ncbi:MAG: redox-regulated ATPase YchF [Solirubrobacterales bacterium]